MIYIDVVRTDWTSFVPIRYYVNLGSVPFTVEMERSDDRSYLYYLNIENASVSVKSLSDILSFLNIYNSETNSSSIEEFQKCLTELNKIFCKIDSLSQLSRNLSINYKIFKFENEIYFSIDQSIFLMPISNSSLPFSLDIKENRIANSKLIKTLIKFIKNSTIGPHLL